MSFLFVASLSLSLFYFFLRVSLSNIRVVSNYHLFGYQKRSRGRVFKRHCYNLKANRNGTGTFHESKQFGNSSGKVLPFGVYSRSANVITTLIRMRIHGLRFDRSASFFIIYEKLLRYFQMRVSIVIRY